MDRTLAHRALTRAVRKFSAYDLVPAYDYVQNVVEWYLNAYIGKKSRDEVSSIYIVGGYLGEEVPFLLRHYGSARFKIFEASRRYQDALARRFRCSDRVSVVRAAVSDKIGTAEFYETNLRGSGSLLQVGDFASASYGTQPAERFEVNTVTLDSVSGGETIDCLWIDVQGAELLVMRGGLETLSTTRSVFTEVSVRPDLYSGGATLSELEQFLSLRGFQLVLLGLDKENMTGNALFVQCALCGLA